MSGRKEKELRRLTERVKNLERERNYIPSKGEIIGVCLGMAVALITAIAKPDTPKTLGIFLIVLFGSLAYPAWHASRRLFRSYRRFGQVSALFCWGLASRRLGAHIGPLSNPCTGSLLQNGGIY